MNRTIKYMLFTAMILMHIDVDAQSIIKHVSGNAYHIIDNVKKPIRGLNTIVNDSSTLKLPASFPASVWTRVACALLSSNNWLRLEV